MSSPIYLGQRSGRGLTLMRRPDRSGMEFAYAYPNDTDTRARIGEHWGHVSHAGRRNGLATIDIPVSPRAQRILFYESSEPVRDAINGGAMPEIASRRASPNRPLRAYGDVNSHRAIDTPSLTSHRRSRHADIALPSIDAGRGRYAPSGWRVR